MSDTARRILIQLSESGTIPARVPLLPMPGEYEHPAYGVMDLSAERIAQFVANHNARIYQQHIPIDAEHETKLSGALGYLGDAHIEADGSVTASVEWTARGEALVGGGGFKYVSPEWYETWTDPAAGATYSDVLIGLAITTRPFFKESALPPLVAHEPGGAANETQPHAQSGTVTAQETPMPEMTEQQVNELVSTKLTEQANSFNERLTSLTERLTATEQENVALKNANRLKSFREEVMGKSDANGIRWFGDIETHIKVMDALGDDDRQAYIEQQRALAKQVETSGAFREIGSGRGETAKSALDEINAKATALAASDNLSFAVAFDRVLTTDSELRSRYAKER